MKTFLTIVITALVTWIFISVVHGVRRGVEGLWMVSAVKAPGEMAFKSIQEDMNAGRYGIAKQKIDAFMATWRRFYSGPDSCKGAGIGDIMVTFSKITEGNDAKPIGSETNQRSSEPSSRQ